MFSLRKPRQVNSLENGSSTARYIHEGQESEETSDNDGNDGETVLGAVGQESWSLSSQRQTVEHTGGSVKEGVSSGEGGGEDTSVDDVGEDLDTSTSHDNDIGRLSSSSGVLEETIIVVGNEHSGDEDTKNLYIQRQFRRPGRNGTENWDLRRKREYGRTPCGRPWRRCDEDSQFPKRH